MTTPRSVHAIGWATYMRFDSLTPFRGIVPSRGAACCAPQDQSGLPIHSSERGRRRRIGSVAGRHVRKTLGGDDGSEGNHGIIAKVKKETREHGAGPSTGEGKNNSDQSEQADEAPGPAELRAVHEAEQDSGDDDSCEGAEADGANRIGASFLGEAGKFTGKEWIKITAENGFFDQRSDEDSHGQEQHGAAAALEEFLDGNVIHVLDARAGDGYENGESAAGEEIHPRVAFACGGIGAESFPAERTPKGQAAQDSQRHVEEKEEQGVPKNVGADQELRLGFDHLLQLFLREMFVGGEQEDGSDLNNEQAGEAENQEDNQMGP